MKKGPKVNVFVSLPRNVLPSDFGRSVDQNGNLVFDPLAADLADFLRAVKNSKGFLPALQYGCQSVKKDIADFDWYRFFLPRLVVLEQDDFSSEGQSVCGRVWGTLAYGQKGCSLGKRRTKNFRFKRGSLLRLPDVFEIGPGPMVSSRTFGASERFLSIVRNLNLLANVNVRDILTNEGFSSGFFELSVGERSMKNAAVAVRAFDDPCTLCGFSFVDIYNYPVNTINGIYNPRRFGNSGIEIDDFFKIGSQLVRATRGMLLWHVEILGEFLRQRLTGLNFSNVVPCVSHDFLYERALHPRQVLSTDFFHDGYVFGSDSETDDPHS